MKPYIQVQSQQSTLEHWKKILTGNNLRSFAAFAYVTDSGAAEIRTASRVSWENRGSAVGYSASTMDEATPRPCKS